MEYINKPKGASDSIIQEIESEFQIKLSLEIIEWWRNSDGPDIFFGYKELQFFSVNEIIGTDFYQLKKYMPTSLPICMDGNGNICVAKIESQKISGFYVSSCGNLGWEDAVFISTTLTEFINDSLSPEARLLNT